MDNNALKFPAYFPAKCPPEEATDEECVLFRLCKNLTLTEQDFVSFYLIIRKSIRTISTHTVYLCLDL